jgi:dTDP-4-dehydrorhamnose 3,5-epimerase
MSNLSFRRLQFPDVIIIESNRLHDKRGFYQEIYKKSEFELSGITEDFVQDYYTSSMQTTLRGLHYQLNPKSQGKLITVVSGEIYDVIVDIRKSSPIFGKFITQHLTSYKNYMLYVPAGFAHGFYVLSGEADVVYKNTSEYAPELERGIIWNDKSIGIQWPTTYPRLSERDTKWPTLEFAEVFE